MSFWQSLNISWFDRAALVKMLLLLRILQTVPIWIPPAFFLLYKKECMHFIWCKKPPRIKYAHLVAPKLMGGLGFLDLQGYYMTCLLTRLLDWNRQNSTKDVVALERSQISLPIVRAGDGL